MFVRAPIAFLAYIQLSTVDYRLPLSTVPIPLRRRKSFLRSGENALLVSARTAPAYLARSRAPKARPNPGTLFQTGSPQFLPRFRLSSCLHAPPGIYLFFSRDSISSLPPAAVVVPRLPT